MTFEKMHLMINHRRRERCGGRFLPLEEQMANEAAHYAMMMRNKYPRWSIAREVANECRVDAERMRHDRIHGGGDA